MTSREGACAARVAAVDAPAPGQLGAAAVAAATPDAGEPAAPDLEVVVGDRHHCAPSAEYVLCSEPQGEPPKKRMAIGHPAPIVDSPGRYITVDYDMAIARLKRVGCVNPACSPLHCLEPRTDQPVAGGSAKMTCWCRECGRPESFNLAGNTRMPRSHVARPYRTDLEASEMACHIFDGSQFRHLKSRALNQGRHPSVHPSKKVRQIFNFERLEQCTTVTPALGQRTSTCPPCDP